MIQCLLKSDSQNQLQCSPQHTSVRILGKECERSLLLKEKGHRDGSLFCCQLRHKQVNMWSPHHALVFFVPHLNPLLPLVLVELVLVQNSVNNRHLSVRGHWWHVSDIRVQSEILKKKRVLPLREQLFTGQIAWCVAFLIVVTILGLDCIGGQEDCCLWRAVNIII